MISCDVYELWKRCIESMIMEKKEGWFNSMKHEHGCEWESA
jgi:hypothetical protein